MCADTWGITLSACNEPCFHLDGHHILRLTNFDVNHIDGSGDTRVRICGKIIYEKMS